MKKTIKNLITTLSLILVITFSVFAVACSNSSNQVASNIPATNIADQGGTGDAENVNQETPTPETPKNETFDISTLNGIYKYTSSEYTFDDKHYDNLSELISFFKTRDENGVFYAAKKLGFDEFLSNITKDADTNAPKAVYIHNGYAQAIVYNEDGQYTFINDENYFIINDGSNFATTRNDIKFEVNENSISIYYQFTYVNDSNQVVSTPLYIKTTLEKQEHTSNLFTGLALNYYPNSLTLHHNNVTVFDEEIYESALIELSNILNLPYEPSILSVIEDALTCGQYNFILLDDCSIQVIEYEFKSIQINPNQYIVTTVPKSFYTFVNNNGSLNYNGTTGKITTIDVSHDKVLVNIEINLMEDVTLTISLY